MSIDQLILDEERKIEQADISRLVYPTSDMAREKELLVGVGFLSVRETEKYNLFQRGDLFALLIEGWVIQGSPSYIIEKLSDGTVESDLAYETDLWEYLLDLVRSEGI